jgi:hypothetical protein
LTRAKISPEPVEDELCTLLLLHAQEMRRSPRMLSLAVIANIDLLDGHL